MRCGPELPLDGAWPRSCSTSVEVMAPPAARHYTFAALVASDRLVAEQPEVAPGGVRAIVGTQRALQADPSLATQVGRRLFPPEEAELIAELFCPATRRSTMASISSEAIASTCQFAQDVGLLYSARCPTSRSSQRSSSTSGKRSQLAFHRSRRLQDVFELDPRLPALSPMISARAFTSSQPPPASASIASPSGGTSTPRW